MFRVATAIVLLGLLTLAPGAANAQIDEAVGVRAQGMSGAFVAVADDASATWWNPAGLAAGAYFNGIIEVGRVESPSRDPTRRSTLRGFVLAMPALGVSYYRIRISEIQASNPTGAGAADRQDRGREPVRLRSLVVHQFGVTTGQSLGDHLVVGSTMKLLRGSFASAEAATGVSIDRAAELDGDGQTHGDLDLGAIATWGAVRAGLVVKNVTQPTFESMGEAIRVRRQVRTGVSTTMSAAQAIVTVAVDADLTRTTTPGGDVRHVAAGVEAWTATRLYGFRAGVSANTVGESRPSTSAGLSVALAHGLYVDGSVTRGADKSRTGWGFDVRVTF